MDWLTVVLRVVHILSGVFWVGGAYTIFGFVLPSAQAVGPDSQRFMEEFAVRRRFPIAVILAALFTVLSGAALYWRDSNGLSPLWTSSPSGAGFGIGGVAGLAAFLVAVLAILPAFRRVGVLGAQLRASGGAPNPEQISQLQAAQRRVRNWGIALTVLLTIAVFFMAISRYLG